MESYQHKHMKSSTKPISIPTNQHVKFQQELKQNFFNPSKNSPPDVFIRKLTCRLREYYSNSH
jgi:hypothetical protein